MIDAELLPLDMDAMRKLPGFWYLGTPYSKHPQGIHVAFAEACHASAHLVRQGISVYCPIAHTHPIAIHGAIDPLDHKIWVPIDEPMVRHAVGLVICKMPTWRQSYGLKVEYDAFVAAGKPIYGMEWPCD